MIVQAFPSGPFETNAYVAACSDTKEAVVIDPAPGSFPKISQFLDEHHLKLTKILLTHSHWDHIGDAAIFKDTYQVPISIHKLDTANLETPGSDGLPLFIKIKGVKPDHFIEEGEIISIGNLEFKVIFTPGHTPGGVCFYNPKENILFSGDTLFKGSIGNLSFPTSQPDLMWPSLEKLSKLPPATKVYSGHGSSTTIGAEPWLTNPKQYFDQ